MIGDFMPQRTIDLMNYRRKPISGMLQVSSISLNIL